MVMSKPRMEVGKQRMEMSNMRLCKAVQGYAMLYFLQMTPLCFTLGQVTSKVAPLCRFMMSGHVTRSGQVM
jgi:hypothetical protein